MDELKKLHDAIKEHPYTVGYREEDWKSYSALLKQFMDLIWKILSPKDSQGKRIHKYNGATAMLHDFSGAILNKNRQHIERCVQCVHRWIDTGKFEEFYILGYKYIPRQYIFDEEDGTYHPVFREDEMGELFKQHEARRAKAYEEGPEAIEKWKQWHGDSYDYYKSAKEYWDKKKEGI